MSLRTNAGPHIRPAATIVIVRDGASGPEVLLTVRPKSMRFMGGAVVFPGGAVAEADRDPRWEQASARSRSDAASALGGEDEADALGTFVCALREAFEEVGFLLAEGPLEQLPRSDADDAGAFLEDCLRLGIKLGTDGLTPAGRWVTPEGSPVRFDARFFIARAPGGWEPDPDPTEVAGCSWATPAAALEDLAAGRTIMAPPTIEMLQRIDGLAGVDEILATTADTQWQSSDEILTARLSPEVAVVLAPNPSALTGPGTNSYVVGRGPTAIIDPAVSDQAYVDALCELAGEVSCVIVTHRHPDHVGGIEAVVGRTGAPVRAFTGELAGGVEVKEVADGDVLSIGYLALEVIHAPGHASDHIVLFDRASGSLFAGDNVLGEGTAVIAPPDGDMGDYLATLEKLRGLGARRIFPGHFRPLNDADEVIAHYIAHRAERRAAVLDALGSPATVEEIVARVYVDTPSHLHPIAALQVRAMLELLEREGEVNRNDDLWGRSVVE